MKIIAEIEDALGVRAARLRGHSAEESSESFAWRGLIYMVFGKIDYINMLPFHVFIKRSPLPARFKRLLAKHKDYPANVNRKFLEGRVDAAFISSIRSRYRRCFDVGIVADKAVWSVIAVQGGAGADFESESSNMLAKVLGVEGQVLIGDKALKYYLQHKERCIDLAGEWDRRYGLPFVFARFCANRDDAFYGKLANAFAKSRVKIPRYILSQYAESRGIAPRDITAYLKKIHYKIGGREKLALKKYLCLARKQAQMR